MNPETISVNGGKIRIKPMDASYIMSSAEPAGMQVMVGCRVYAKDDQWPNALYIEYYKKLTAAYGSSAILAWQNKTVVGFLPFVPLNCGIDLPACLHYVEESRFDEVKSWVPVPQNDMTSETLKVHCLSVSAPLQRQGIGSAMVRYLIDWAGENGWKKIEGWAFDDGGYTWLPDITFWEKCGFKRGRQRPWDEYITGTGYEYALDL